MELRRSSTLYSKADDLDDIGSDDSDLVNFYPDFFRDDFTPDEPRPEIEFVDLSIKNENNVYVVEPVKTNKSDVLDSLILASQERVFACSLCDYMGVTENRLRVHMKIHAGENNFISSIPDIKSIREDSLDEHIERNSHERNISCRLCDYKGVSKEHFLIHAQLHTAKRRKNYACSFCNYKSVKSGDLILHSRVHTAVAQNEKKCTVRNIKNTLHTSEEFSCEVCRYKFLNKPQLMRHICRSNADRKYACDLCEYRGISKSRLNIHMRIHQETIPKKARVWKKKHHLHRSQRSDWKNCLTRCKNRHSSFRLQLSGAFEESNP